MNYGKRMKEIMQERHIKQQELADKIKTKQQNVSIWLRNEYPTLEALEKMCKGVGIELYELFISKDELAKKNNLPPEILDYCNFLSKQPPEIIELLKDITFKVLASFEKYKINH